jgi:prefoldin subunit 5
LEKVGVAEKAVEAEKETKSKVENLKNSRNNTPNKLTKATQTRSHIQPRQEKRQMHHFPLPQNTLLPKQPLLLRE